MTTPDEHASPSDLARYHRQMLLPGVGAEGQARLRASTALLVGCGALGCAIADTLSRAGIGQLVLVDRDVVELTNLQRQALFDERDVREGLPKAEAARRRLGEINAQVEVTAHVDDFTPANADSFLTERPSLILDGTDNFETRFLMNDLAVKHRLPLVYGGAVGATGMCMTIRPGVTPCLRCLFEGPAPPGSTPTCDTAGVLGPAISIVAAAQATDALKLLLGREDLLSNTLLEFDLWRNTRRRLEVTGARRADCPCCVHREFDFLAGASHSTSHTLCGRGAVQVSAPARGRVDLQALGARLAQHGSVRTNDFLLACALTNEPADEQLEGSIELTVFADGRAIVKGTSSPQRARTLYAKYVGA